MSLKILQDIFVSKIEIHGNFISREIESVEAVNQTQTKDIFSDKWKRVDELTQRKEYHQHALDWFLQLYGFNSEKDLAEYLSDKPIILDAGCGLGFKAAWLAQLAPNSIVVGIDISDAAHFAAKTYGDIPNLFFLKGDIANTGIKDNSIDFVVCDQVIMHTEQPAQTFSHLSKITKTGGEFACYVYAKKALPRELIDDYFRNRTHDISNEEMWQLSSQLTELGKRLSELNVSFESPDIPLLGIKGGNYDIQRFIYWNFIKCFWNDKWGEEMSKVTNYDWYAPSNAMRYSREEFEQIIRHNKLSIVYFHQEEACYSGRFSKENLV